MIAAEVEIGVVDVVAGELKGELVEVWWGLGESKGKEGKEKEEWESVLVGWHGYIIIIKKEVGVEILKGFVYLYRVGL